MKILVTGGAGFIGSHLVDRLLSEGHRVSVLDNLSTGKRARLSAAEVALTVGDVADEKLVQALVAKAELVVHLAAVASVEMCRTDAQNAHRTNLTGTVTLFDAAAKAGGVPVIYASSAAVYGNNAQLPLDEDADTAPLSEYGTDKLAGESAAWVAAEFHNLATTGLRFFNVYGPRQDASSPYSGVISKFMAAAKAGMPLTFYGDGEQTRDFIYVGDVVELILAAMRKMDGAKIYNGCTGQAVSLKQLARTIGEVLSTSITTQHTGPRAGDIRHSLGNPARAAEELGFTATTTLAQGLAALMAADA